MGLEFPTVKQIERGAQLTRGGIVSTREATHGTRGDDTLRLRTTAREAVTRLGLAALACLLAVPAAAQVPVLPDPAAIILVGVVIPDTGEPMAIVEDPRTHEQTIHTLGAEIGGGRLTKILKDRVVLSSGAVAIEVRLASPPPPPAPSRPTRFRPPPVRTRPIAPR
jgi:hypothetical protein